MVKNIIKIITDRPYPIPPMQQEQHISFLHRLFHIRSASFVGPNPPYCHKMCYFLVEELACGMYEKIKDLVLKFFMLTSMLMIHLPCLLEWHMLIMLLECIL